MKQLQMKFWLKLILWFCIGLSIVGISTIVPPQTSPVFAQYVRPADAAKLVYEILPDFPKENNYINQETGEVEEENTLLSRFIAYHIYVKNRPPIFRFDWKLTLADYLGANEKISLSSYPSHLNLQEHPLEGDRKIIDSLTRPQREELVFALLQVFNPDAVEALRNPQPVQPSPTPSPTPSTPSSRPPQPGDAELLK